MGDVSATSLRCVAGALTAAVLLCVASAGAQTDEQRAGARAAATEGLQAFSEERWSDAADLFERAEGVVHSPVHLLYIARANERRGFLVKAREVYMRIVHEQLGATAPDAWHEAKVSAREESSNLESRLPALTVRVSGTGGASVRVTRNGVDVLPALLGVSQPVDPGRHTLEARAVDGRVARGLVSLREADRETIVLDLDARGAAPSPPGGSRSPAVPDQPRAGAQGGVPPLAWVAFGLGAVGIGVGTVFALRASSKVDEANSLCDLATPGGGSSGCPDQERARIEDLDATARSANTIALVGFVAGGLGVAGGVTLLLLDPSGEPGRPSSGRVVPWVGPGSAGVAGRF